MKQNKFLISVVLPTYNGEQFIQRAINSVLSQNYKEFELIITDDNSSDGTLSIIETFDDSRLKLYKKRKGEKGIFHNLNFAIEKSKGKFIQIFCQDDEMAPSFLDKQIEFFKDNPDVKMIFSNIKVLNELNFLSDLESRYSYRESFPQVFTKEDSIVNFIKYGCMPGNLSPVMLNRDVVPNIGLFDTNFPYAGDFDYWIRISREYKIGYNKSNYMYLRRHAKQASKTLNKKNFHLFYEIGQIYTSLSLMHGKESNQLKIIEHVNSTYGVLFFKLTIKSVFTLNIKKIIQGVDFLNKNPFNIYKIFYYFIQQIIFRKQPPKLDI
jgi:glycosyltransferase involved in cell wall biosynthesis